MTLIKQAKSSHQVQTMKEDFLSVNITISDKEVEQLIDYQYTICNQIDWVELNPHKIEAVIQSFVYSPYLSSIHYMNVLKKVIYAYYHLRKHFEYSTPDENIYNTLYQVFYESAGLQTQSLYTIAKKKLIKEGSKERNEPFDTME